MAVILFTPPLGTRLVLTKAWRFKLFNCYRNATLFELLGLSRQMTGRLTSRMRTLPDGTELVIEKYQVTRFHDETDRVYFRLVGAHVGPSDASAAKGSTRKRPVRFWASLEDVNGLEVELKPKK